MTQRRTLRDPYALPVVLAGAALLAVYLELLSRSSAGVAVSVLLFGALACVSVASLRHGIVLTWVAAVVIPEFPRDILDVYEALEGASAVRPYEVLSSITVGPATLLLLLFALNTALALTRPDRIKLGTAAVVSVALLLGAGAAGLAAAHLAGLPTATRALTTDAKFPILLAMGVVQGGYLRGAGGIELLARAIVALPAYLGARAIFFIVGDLFLGMPQLDVMTQPLLSTAVLAYCARTGAVAGYTGFPRRALLYLSLFNASRGLLAVQGVFLVGARLLGGARRPAFARRFSRRLVVELMVILGVLVVVLAVANPRLFAFMLWKLADLDALFGDGSLSGSGQVRKHELLNVAEVTFSSPLRALFGSGFGGTFTYARFPLPADVVLDLKSYSAAELARNVFSTTHSFFSFVLLKYGLVGLAVYVFIPLYAARAYFRSRDGFGWLLGSVAVLHLYNYYWRIEFMVLMGMLLGAREVARAGALDVGRASPRPLHPAPEVVP